MNTIKNVGLVLMLVLMPACGQQLVEFEIDSGTTSPDAGRDAGTTADAGIDAGMDAGMDAGTDAGMDAGLDAGMDAGLDVTPPVVISTVPVDQAMNVLTSTLVSATFSEPMNASTLNAATFTLTQGVTPVPGLVTFAGVTARFTPTMLSPGTTYTATITTGATDLAGNPLASNFVWTFTTGTPADTTRPTVILTNPLDLAMNVPISRRVTATFSEAMNPATIDATTFKLARGLTPVVGVVSYDTLTAKATFAPAMPLLVGATYTATVTTGVADLAGNTMLVDFVWTFTTGACGQGPVVLGAAGNFAVLAGSTVTNTGMTSVTGDLGVSPGSAVTGFPPGNVVGTQHAANPTSAAGMFDLTAAYNDAAGRTLCPVAVAGNLGGQTLAPGLYKSTGSLSISSGALTLDAQGDSDAIFIFQMASTLTTSSGRQVILAGGAKASNIFWQVGTAATLGTTSVMHGTLMADQAITLMTGASLTGRALARIGAVNLDTNAIVRPVP